MRYGSYSRVEAALFAQFLRPRCPQHIPPIWTTVLGRPVMDVLDQHYRAGALVNAPLAGRLDALFGLARLKDVARDRQIPVSGRKAALIDRLIIAAPDEMIRLTGNLRVMVCAPDAARAAQTYEADEAAATAQKDQRVRDALMRGAYEDAVRIVDHYESHRVIPRGINMSWGSEPNAGEVAGLAAMWTRWPVALRQVRPAIIPALRHAAAYMYLNGTTHIPRDQRPKDHETGLAMTFQQAAQMLVRYGVHHRNLTHYQRTPHSVRVRIETCNDDRTCDACLALARATYRIDAVPELPHPECTATDGCRCTTRIVSVYE